MKKEISKMNDTEPKRPFYKRKIFTIPAATFAGLVILGSVLPKPVKDLDGAKGNPSATTAIAAADTLTPTSKAKTSGTKPTRSTGTTDPATTAGASNNEPSSTVPTQMTGAPAPTGKLLSDAYPVSCETDRAGDSTYDEGDIVAGKVALQGDGLLFSWTTSKAPRLLPGDYINYFATFTIQEPYLSSNFNVFMINNDGKLEAQAFVTSPDNRSNDFSDKIKVVEEGKTLTIWLPGLYTWPLIGNGEQGRLTNYSPLTTGGWELITNRDTSTLGARSGSDDHCGANDTDRIPPK
jgi:hypothetical protein